MSSSLKERFARLGPSRAVDRVRSGSPATFLLFLAPPHHDIKRVDAALALVKRGATMLRAKRAIEAVLDGHMAYVNLPILEDAAVLGAELAEAGVVSVHQQPVASPDVRLLRERLGLTREQFSLRFGLEVETVRNWETGKREPDMTARSYLRVISSDPDRVERAFALGPDGSRLTRSSA